MYILRLISKTYYFYVLLRQKYLDRNITEDSYAEITWYQDMLSRLEEDSPVYSKYCMLIEGFREVGRAFYSKKKKSSNNFGRLSYQQKPRIL